MRQLLAKDHRALPAFMRTLAPNHRATQSLFLSNPDATAREQGPATTTHAAQPLRRRAPPREPSLGTEVRKRRYAASATALSVPPCRHRTECATMPLQLWVVTKKHRIIATKACGPTYRFIGFYAVNDIDA